MANIQTRTTADNRVMYTARIRIKGFPQQTATFSRLTDAKQWVQKTEARIREGMHFSKAEAKRHTFTEMVQRYTRTVLTNKSATIQYQYAQQLSKWSSLLGDLTLDKITPALIAEQRENLAAEITPRGNLRSPASVNRYLAALSSVFSVAIKEWQWVDENPVKKISKLREKKGRERFLSADEIDHLLQACQESYNKDLYLVVVLSLICT